MTEPKTIRETSLVVEALASRVETTTAAVETRFGDFKDAFDARLGQTQRMVWVVIGLLGTLMLGAAGLYVQVGEIKTDLAVAKATLKSIDDRTGKTEKAAEEIRSEQIRARESLARIESRFTGPPSRPDDGAATTASPPGR